MLQVLDREASPISRGSFLKRVSVSLSVLSLLGVGLSLLLLSLAFQGSLVSVYGQIRKEPSGFQPAQSSGENCSLLYRAIRTDASLTEANRAYTLRQLLRDFGSDGSAVSEASFSECTANVLAERAWPLDGSSDELLDRYAITLVRRPRRMIFIELGQRILHIHIHLPQ